jgi:menaquinone-dependent protoporphyrinogen IX oxidase
LQARAAAATLVLAVKILVAYYSRTGNTRRVAELLAEALGARGSEVTVEEILDRRARRGLGGLLSACVDATFGRRTEVHAPEARVAEFDMLVVGTPIWAWNGTPAASAFCRLWGKRARRCALFCTMLGPAAGRTFSAMSSELGDEPVATLAVARDHLKDPNGLERMVAEFAEKLTS